MKPSEIFRSYCDKFASGDAPGVASLFAEDGEFWISMLKEPIRGRERIEIEMHRQSTGQSDVAVEITTAIDHGDRGFIEGNYLAKIVGTGGKIDGSPHRGDFRFAAEIEVVEGKIRRLSEYMNSRPLHPEERQKMFTINRLSPYFSRTVDEGCMEWSVYNNMHFPMVYGRTPYEEYHALLNGVTLWDVGLERQTQLKGADAVAFLDYLCCRDMSGIRVGDCRYTLMTDDEGLLLSDPVVLYPYDNTIWISHGNTDVTLWARGIAKGSQWDVEVSEPDVAPMQVQGPLSIPLMDEICTDKVSLLKNYKCMSTRIQGHEVVVSRTGWSSGEGFEIYPMSTAHGREIWDLVRSRGAAYGIMVTGPNIFRAVERGVTDVNYYNNSGMNALEDLAAKYVHLDSPADFIGKDALIAIRRQGVGRKSVGLLVKGDIPRLEWFWDLTDGRGNNGVVRWAAYSFELKQYIAIALVDASNRIGDEVEITHPLGKLKAQITEVPFVSKTGG